MYKDRKMRLSASLMVIFLISLFSLPWDKGFFHKGGGKVLGEIVGAFIRPDLSGETVNKALFAAWQTFSYALISLSIALILALIMGILASGVLFRSRAVSVFFRGVLGFLRAVHELVWAWLFVTAIGLKPVAAVFAVAIPYAGALGKVYADILTQTDEKPIVNLEVSGAGPLKKLFYGYLPLSFREMMSYTLYRLECAVRSSSVLSFVGLGGLGFQIQLAMSDLNFKKVWTYIFFLVALILLINLWGKGTGRRKDELKSGYWNISAVILVILIILSWVSVFERGDFKDILTAENRRFIGEFLKGLAGAGDNTPAFLDPIMWQKTLKLISGTIIMSIIAAGTAFFGMLPFVVSAASNVRNGSLIKRRGIITDLMFLISRGIFLIARSVPELLWATILIFVMKPGILTGAFALGIHNMGVLGKLLSEVIEEMDENPIRNLSVSGAGVTEILFYGIFPEVTKKFINFTLYRWEIIIRTTIVVGFVGAGGLGQNFRLAMSFFRYSEITLYMIAYILLVWAADVISYLASSYIDLGEKPKKVMSQDI